VAFWLGMGLVFWVSLQMTTVLDKQMRKQIPQKETKAQDHSAVPSWAKPMDKAA
jgi:hypothetical protein